MNDWITCLSSTVYELLLSCVYTEQSSGLTGYERREIKGPKSLGGSHKENQSAVGSIRNAENGDVVQKGT